MLYISADIWRPHHEPWPSLPLDAWQETYATLHRWLQIVGKIRLTQSAPINHWWHCALYVTPRGLTTSSIPHPKGAYQIDFDFIDHQLLVATSAGHHRSLHLRARSVAEFYREVQEMLGGLGIPMAIRAIPDEVPNPIPFEEDEQHASYDADCANRCWRVLLQVDQVMKQFRSGFIGKCSPVQFFWGSFDMAVSRFSGRPAPERPDADSITREAYSHEVSSCGFWPGSPPLTGPAFYAYHAPAPGGYNDAKIEPEGAYYDAHFSEFILPYDVVRESDAPEATVLRFFQSTYEAGANLAGWDRQALERPQSARQGIAAAA